MSYVKQFRAKAKDTGADVILDIYASSADTSISAVTSLNTEAIGNVEKYSEYDGEKYHEGLTFVNGAQRGVIELNDKGNLAVESLSKHLNLESAKGVQIKPTTNIILDSTRRIVSNKGNEIQVEAKFDDYGKVTGFDGSDEPWAELKINSRNLDLRCHDHGGIALQIAGHDGSGFENKIKFESDRTTQIGATKHYSGEGGKGLEFGTFNNEHASLFCGDYRFKGDANVYGVTRQTPTQTSTGKIDYPTQNDDFKDVIDPTKAATWNEIIDAAKKCANLDETVRAEVAKAALSGEIDTSIFVTKSDVNDIVASAISEAHIDLTGLATEEWVLDQNYIDALPDGVQYIKMGKSKGNFAVDVTGKYTWELTSPKSATTVDEYDDVHAKGDRVINYTNEAFYTDPNKVYYKAGMETKLADNVTVVPADTIVYNQACNLTFDVPEGAYQYFPCTSADTSFYEDPTKFAYKCLIKDSLDFEGNPRPKKYMVDGAGLSESAITYYNSKATVYDEDGVTVLVPGEWERVDVWKKSTLWSQNEININLETDSKIKFAGKKIETVWTYDDVDHKMDDILLSTNTLSTDANEVVFEQKISKNGDREGQDSEIVYSFGNNVADTEKVPDFEAFKANYNGKHTPKTDEELQSMYDAFLAEGQSFEIRVKVSELLGLVSRVAELEARLNALENN
jgi:hypothetical protein